MSLLDPTKTYLTWNGSEFPNSSSAMFTAPAGSTIDWGDGTVEIFDTEASEHGTMHTYTDGKDTHTIAISGLKGIDYQSFVSCHSLISITIGDDVTSIGGAAFVSCRSLKSVTFGENSQLTRILDWAFAYCSSLTGIVIPDSVTGIGDDAFDSCSSLTSVVMGDSVTRIGNFAFARCTSLQSIIVFATDPPTLGSDMPSNVQSIYVMQSSKSAYKAATNWNADDVVEKIVSDNLYMSFIRFNQKNKEYINKKVSDSAVEAQKVDLTDYVKNTDYATNEKAGVGLVAKSFSEKNSTGGIILNSTNNRFTIRRAKNEDIDAREVNDYIDGGIQGGNRTFPICPANLDYAVKSVLTKPLIELTDEEKEIACEWLGAIKKYTTTITDTKVIRVYAVDANGNQLLKRANSNQETDGLMLRDGAGRAKVNDPIDGKDIVNKSYLEVKIAELVARIEALENK